MRMKKRILLKEDAKTDQKTDTGTVSIHLKASKPYNKSLVSTQNEINLQFCLLLQSFEKTN